MNVIEDLILAFQDLVAQVPEFAQPFVVMLAGMVPFIEGDAGAPIGVIGGLNPILAGVAAAAGNFLAVLAVVALSSRTREAVVSRHRAAANGSVATLEADPEPKPESKGKQRVKRWLVRFGVPGASLLAPLAIPTHITAATLVASGTPRAWVLLWQAIAIVLWTTLTTVLAWLALAALVG
ncbi:MAG: small multidrug efflux protein [Actinomycetota bacterium]